MRVSKNGLSIMSKSMFPQEEKPMSNFHNTIYGKRFFEDQLPELIKLLTRLVAVLEKQNDKEEE